MKLFLGSVSNHDGLTLAKNLHLYYGQIKIYLKLVIYSASGNLVNLLFAFKFFLFDFRLET